MPVRGSEFGLRRLRASCGTQTKVPELPPERRCRHSRTSSKLVNTCWVRMTPTGLPVQIRRSSFQVHVSGLQLTLMKSCSPSGRHPCPLPSMNARGSTFSCPKATKAKIIARRKKMTTRCIENRFTSCSFPETQQHTTEN